MKKLPNVPKEVDAPPLVICDEIPLASPVKRFIVKALITLVIVGGLGTEIIIHSHDCGTTCHNEKRP